jgi:hypothetical protein
MIPEMETERKRKRKKKKKRTMGQKQIKEKMKTKRSLSSCGCCVGHGGLSLLERALCFAVPKRRIDFAVDRQCSALYPTGPLEQQQIAKINQNLSDIYSNNKQRLNAYCCGVLP